MSSFCYVPYPTQKIELLFQNRYSNHNNKPIFNDVPPTDDAKPTLKVEKEDWQPVSKYEFFSFYVAICMLKHGYDSF